jgi:hypothetical protein
MKIDGLPTKNLKMVIFYSYVKLPEGKCTNASVCTTRVHYVHTKTPKHVHSFYVHYRHCHPDAHQH